MTRRLPNAKELAVALKALPLPGGRKLHFLRAHCQAPGKALTAAKLAKAAKYKSWHAINLHYGLLAESVGQVIGRKGEGLSLLLEFAKPKSITNEQWVLVMRPEFVSALRMAGWVK